MAPDISGPSRSVSIHPQSHFSLISKGASLRIVSQVQIPVILTTQSGHIERNTRSCQAFTKCFMGAASLVGPVEGISFGLGVTDIGSSRCTSSGAGSCPGGSSWFSPLCQHGRPRSRLWTGSHRTARRYALGVCPDGSGPMSDSDEQLPHLETFSKAAELGSFTGAARVLGLSQAAVSQRIHVLERALGKPLFLRRAGRVLPTDAGRTLYGFARQILDLHRQARHEVTGHESPPNAELHLAASTIPGEHLLPALLSDFARRHPHIHVRVAVGDSSSVMVQVERGEISLGLVGRKADSPHLESLFLANDRMVLVVPPGHPWGRRKRVSVKQLGDHPLILRESGSGLRYCFEKSLERAGLSPAELRVTLELGSNEAIKEAVLRGVGMAVLSIYAVRKEIQSGQLHSLTVSGLRCDREMYVVRDRRRVLPPPARLFLTCLESSPIPAP